MKSLGKGVVTWSFGQYRSNAEKEYNSFWQAMFRELIQNANDAGSTRIAIDIADDCTITCTDNGCGMDLDVIQNKLLVIGGSYKNGEAVGGLGKAKELLFFSQPSWTILTNDHKVEGTGGEYEIFELPKRHKGTKVILHQPDDIDIYDIRHAREYVIDRCEIAASITLDGQKKRPRVNRGKMVRDIHEMGLLYLTKTQLGRKITGECYVHVRVNGCWMFDKWVGDHDGRIILDIDSNRLSPMEGLTANRDGLKMHYANVLDSLVQEIAIDKKSALINRKPVVTRIQGDGEVAVISDSDLDKMVESLMNESIINTELLAAETENFKVNEERLQVVFKHCHSDGDLQSALTRYMKIINYEPDFIIYEDPENSSWSSGRIQKFMKTQKASTIAQVWTETLKQVFWDNQISTRFTAGFMFDDTTEAMRLVTGKNEQYLINPRFVPPTGIQNKVAFMHYMRTTAIHEINHRHQSYHDEDFMSSYHKLEAATWNSHRVYAKIGKLR